MSDFGFRFGRQMTNDSLGVRPPTPFSVVGPSVDDGQMVVLAPIPTARPRITAVYSIECLPQFRHLFEEFDATPEIPREVGNLVGAGFASDDFESQGL